MWWSDRRRLIATLAASAALAGCGFAPALAPGGAAARLRGRIAPDEPTSTAAFDFVRAIEERFGPPGAAPLLLGYALGFSQRAAGVVPDGTAVRNVLEGSVSFALRDATGAAIATGRIVDASTWSTGGTAAAAAAAEIDAQRRLVRILADRVAAALVAADPEGAP